MFDLANILIKMVKQGVEALSQEEKNMLKTLMDMKNIHYILSKISVKEIIDKSDYFNNLDVRKLNDNSLFSELMKSISFDVEGLEYRLGVMFPSIIKYPKGTRFFRIRRLLEGDKEYPYKTLSIEQDIWNAPASCCKIGRLNNEGESLLYTSVYDPDICLEEMKIEEGENFCLIVYEANKDIHANLIGIWKDRPELSNDENLKMRLITKGLKDLFMKDVGKGTEFLYRVSAGIVKNYYDLPPEVQDAWGYPSIAAKSGLNCCFKPQKAKGCLNEIGAIICSVGRIDNSCHYSRKCISLWNKELEKFIFYPGNSPIGLSLFPEIPV